MAADITDPSLLVAARQQVAATLAAAMIGQAGRTHSAAEAMQVFQNVYWCLYPEPDSAHYKAWKSEKRDEWIHE